VIGWSVTLVRCLSLVVAGVLVKRRYPRRSTFHVALGSEFVTQLKLT
jgi:hypothetical protein